MPIKDIEFAGGSDEAKEYFVQAIGCKDSIIRGRGLYHVRVILYSMQVIWRANILIHKFKIQLDYYALFFLLTM